MSESIVIVGAARTPMGSFQGDFSSLSAHDLGGAAIKAAVERAGIDPAVVGEVLFGNCLMAGQGQAPARQAAYKGGLPDAAGAVTLSKMCGSAMKAAMLSHDLLLAGTHDVIVAGGMESMTNAPYLMLKGRGGETVISIDEGPGKVKLDKIPTLKPAFKKDGGTITAASSSSINDGAAALVMTTASQAQKLGAKPIARIVGHATHAQQPEWFSTAPVGAVAKLFKKIGWSVKDVDLWEVNEAFAVVPMALMKELGVAHDIVNVHGGACALGHPIGASGARIMVTLMYALKARGLTKGLATLCIGGGEATAVALELL